MLQLVVVEVGGPERHDEVPEQQLIMTNELIARSSTGSRCAPEPDEGAVRVGEEADDDVAVEDGHGGLVAVQDAVLDGARRRPVEHARRVVLHLRLLEVKVLGLQGIDSVVL